MRRSIAALCLVAVALLPACSRSKAPNSLFDAAGYHVRGDKVYYLAAFPGNASEIAGADVVSFKAFDTTYAKDRSNAYFDGQPIPGADATSFDVLNRSGFAKDRNHVYQLDRPISDDPAHFELLDGGLSKDSTAVYWTDGGVLSDDPAHFAIVSNNDHYLFTKDNRTVHKMHGGSSISPTRSSTRMRRRSVRSTARMPATPVGCTGWARRSTVPTRLRSAS
jgi:DKNYY family